jgi:hypothetical protein
MQYRYSSAQALKLKSERNVFIGGANLLLSHGSLEANLSVEST